MCGRLPEQVNTQHAGVQNSRVWDSGVTIGWLLRLVTGPPMVGGPTKREKARGGSDLRK